MNKKNNQNPFILFFSSKSTGKKFPDGQNQPRSSTKTAKQILANPQWITAIVTAEKKVFISADFPTVSDLGNPKP